MTAVAGIATGAAAASGEPFYAFLAAGFVTGTLVGFAI
jgi:hypothetical protein